MGLNIASLPVGTYIQGGYGVPTHISPKGTEYTDLDTAIVYINKDGVATWAEFLDSTFVFTGGTSTYFTGGTVTGATIFTGGLSANTLSATTYQNLPNDLPPSGTTGQILSKIDNTDYNVQWIDNYASQLKHEVKAGVAINKGQAVYVSSASGTNMVVSKADYSSETTSSKTMGLLMQNLSTNGIGLVITEGLLTGTGAEPLNTNAGNAGDPVWLGANGDLIFGLTNKPIAPLHLVFIGIITRKSTTVGEIFVKVQNGFELDELHTVRLTGKTYGDLLTYSAYNGSDVWVNSKTLNGSYIITGNTTVGGSMKSTTISATTYLNLPTDVRVTGATYSNNTFTFTNNTGGTFSTLFNTITGLTVNGNISVTGTTFNGGGTFSKAGYAAGDLILDNNGTDSPGLLLYYGNNNNWGIDTWSGTYNVLSGQLFRFTNNLNESGGAVKMAMDVYGNVVVNGFVSPGAWRAGQIIKDTMLSNTEVTVNATTIATSTSDTDFITYSYTPVSTSSYLIIHYHLASYDASSGTGNDSWISRIKVDGNEITYSKQSTVNGNRTGVLFPLMGRYTNSNTTAKSIVVACRRDSADDSIVISNLATSMWLRITEIGR